MDAPRWIESVLLIGAVQGLFLALLLPKIAKANKKANVFLSMLLVATSISLIIYLNVVIYETWPGRMLAFLDTGAFLFAPLVYLYIKRLLFTSGKTSKKVTLHFLPALLHLLYGLSLFRYSAEEMAGLIASNALRNEWLLIFSGLILLTLGYWLAAVRLLVRFGTNQKSIIGFKQNVQYISIFLFALLLGDFISVMFGLDYFFGVRFFSFTETYIGWIIIPFLVYSVSYIALTRPEVMKVRYRLEKKSTKRVSDEELEHYRFLLEQQMHQDKLYLDPKLTLNVLAARLNLHSTKLSYIINTGYGCNFYDFINRYRVDDFVKKLRNNEHHKQTLLGLAYDVGFNSKTTFNKSFKQFFQVTPREFARKMETS